MVSTSQLALRFLFAFLALFAVPLVGAAVLQRTGVVGASADEATQTAWAMGLFLLAAIAIAAFARLLPTAVPWRPARLLAVIAVYVPTAVLWTGLLVGYLQLLPALGVEVTPQATLEFVATADCGRLGTWVVITAIVIGAPLAEEIVFRGYLLGALLQHLPRWPALLLGGAAFGLVHGMEYALPVGLLGVLFGWLFTRHGSLLAPMLAHALHNGITVAVTLLWPGHLDLLYPQ